jgi:hypothetical protein
LKGPPLKRPPWAFQLLTRSRLRLGSSSCGRRPRQLLMARVDRVDRVEVLLRPVGSTSPCAVAPLRGTGRRERRAPAPRPRTCRPGGGASRSDYLRDAPSRRTPSRHHPVSTGQHGSSPVSVAVHGKMCREVWGGVGRCREVWPFVLVPSHHAANGTAAAASSVCIRVCIPRLYPRLQLGIQPGIQPVADD